MKKPLALVILLVIACALVALPWYAPYFYIFLATEILILGLFALSFNLAFGYTGMLSFGHAAFFGVGAYATAMLLLWLQWPLILCLLVSAAAGALLAFIFGLLSARLNEVYFAMLTLAFGMLTYSVIHQWRSVTNGSDGLSGFRVNNFGLGLDLSLGNPVVYYHVVLVIAALAIALLYLISHSSFGMVLRAIRLNAERVSFCGLNIRSYRVAAFTVSGAFAGLAGGLMAPFLRIASPELVHWSMSAEPVLMSILGGTSFFFGPLVGATVFVLLETWITNFTQNWMLILGIILGLIVMFFRNGLLGTIVIWNRERKKS